MKNSKNKLKFILPIVAILIVGIYFAFFNNNYKTDRTDNKTGFYLPLKILFVDKNKTEDNVNLDYFFNGDNFDKILFADSIYVPIEKDNNNYVVNLEKYVNKTLFDSFIDVVFAKYNNRGEVLSDITYDDKNRVINIPDTYFSDEENKTPLQVEFVSRITDVELKNINVDLTINKFVKKTEHLNLNGYDSRISFFAKKGLNKENIKIYANDSKGYLPGDAFDYDKKTGVITFDYSSIFLNNIDVVLDKFSISNAKAIDLSNIHNAYTFNLDSAPVGVSQGSIFYFDADVIEGQSNLSANNAIGTPFVPVGGANAKNAYGGGHYVPYNTCPSTDGACSGTSFDTAWSVLVNSDDGYQAAHSSQMVFAMQFPSQISNGTATIALPSANVILECVHISGYNEYESGWVKRSMIAQVLQYDANARIMVVAFMVRGNLINTQAAWGVYRFTWPEDNKGYIQINKSYDVLESTISGSDISFKAYNGFSGACDWNSEVATSKYDSTYGVYTLGFENGAAQLTVGSSYCVEESSNNYIVDYIPSGSTVVGNDNGRKYLYVTISDASNENTQVNAKYEIVDVKNVEKRYCVKVKKVDSEDSSKVMNGFTFDLSKNSTVVKSDTTTGDGTITFSNLASGSYKVSETSADGTSGYWNDTKNNANSIDVSLTEMTYDSSTGKFSCPSTVNTYTKEDHKQYYCIKVKKVDKVTGDILPGATFKTTINGNEVTHADDWDGKNDGYTTFFTDIYSGTFNVNETKAPEGYTLDTTTLQVTASLLPRELSKEDAKTECMKDDAKDSSGNAINSKAVVANDLKNFVNWYKVTEDNTRAPGAEFTVTDNSGHKIYQSGKTNVTDASGITKSCYKYSSSSTGSSDTFISDSNGEVCISGVTDSKYIVTETKPAEYHTFDSTNQKTLTTSTSFKSMSDDNKLVNRPTEFEFDKTVSSGDGNLYKNLTTEQLKKIEFNVFDSNGNILYFVFKNGKYEFAGNNIDGPGTTGQTSALFLNDNRKILIDHLPKGTYSIREKANTNGTCDCTVDGSCIGFYTPSYTNASDYTFTIGDCSSSSITSSAQCSNPKKATQDLENKPTEIKFRKADFYGYEDQSDVVDFVDDKERSDFDKIEFQLKDANGNPLRVVKVGNHITDASKACLSDSDYAEYRYIPSYITNAQLASWGLEVIENGVMHTCGGHIKVTHLCRGTKFYIEEISVPANSVFTLPEKAADRTAEYNISCCEGETTQTTTTNIIVDKGTRVRFEKRDSKYNYLIPDETTTFKVYRCAKGTTCHPSDVITSDMKLIKFSERAVISGDEEDPNDAAGLAGVEVYNAMSDSDVQSGKNYVTELHPYHGILVLRYLQSGYNYVLLETKAPRNYTLPEGRNAETEFTVRNDTVSVKEVDVPNKPTSLLIRKYSDDGNLLAGAQFKVYEGTTCDTNLSAMNQPKTALKLKTIRDGLYEARPPYDDSEYTTVQTCSDKNGKCSQIPVNQLTRLTYEDTIFNENINNTYVNSFADFANTTTSNGNSIELQEGEALIQYLEYGHCYIIEETKAPEGYSLPKNTEDRFTMVTIEEDERYAVDTDKALVNKPTPFTFYKFDEFNNLIDGAEFKLQKLNEDKKYIDVKVSEKEEKGLLFYKVDEDSNNTTITTKNGSATVYFLTSGQYRILETKAAPGKELSKNPNVATFFVDEAGNVYGSSLIVNKSTTITREELNDSSAEFIIGIQTGQTVIRYGLIIAVLVALITGLMILIKKSK